MNKLLTLLLMSTFAFSQKPLEIKEVAKNYYVYTTYQIYAGQPFPANGMYILTNKGAILIDTPWDTSQNQALLDSIFIRHGQKVVVCIATHAHADRTAGLNFMREKGIKTYTTKETDKISQQLGAPRATFLIASQKTFQIGSTQFESFYPGKGHTSDNIVIWFPKAKILYGGCFIKSLESSTLGNLEDASPKAWIKSTQVVLDRYPTAQLIIPGHQAWGGRELLEHSKNLTTKYKP